MRPQVVKTIEGVILGTALALSIILIRIWVRDGKSLDRNTLDRGRDGLNGHAFQKGLRSCQS